MNQIFVAAAGLSIVLVMLSFGRKPRILSSRIGIQNDPGINHNESLALVQKPSRYQEPKKILLSNENKSWVSPKTKQERIALKKHLNKLISSNPDERLQAIQIADFWNNECVLPILRRGLKDSDKRVIIAAAAAIIKYKGKSKKVVPQSEDRPPRNVSLMR